MRDRRAVAALVGRRSPCLENWLRYAAGLHTVVGLDGVGRVGGRTFFADPHQPSESRKYFSLPQEIGPGLIFDIDVYRGDIEIEGFKLSRLLRLWSRHVSNVVDAMSDGAAKCIE